MPTVKVRNLKNEEVGDLELSDAVFGAELNESLIHAAVKAHLASARQGTVKRHNFNRGPESHGSMNVRRPGSIGASAYPSRVIKGTRSSGHMGDKRVTVKGLTVARVDVENNLLMIRGAVPGANGSVVVVKKSEKK